MTDILEVGRTVLASQPLSVHLGAELVAFEPGRAVLALDLKPEYLQQHGFAHGGIVSYLVDNALTFAGGSVLGVNVVTAEFKVNFVRPARGDRLEVEATAEGSGSRLAVCRCEVRAIAGDKITRCALAQGTIARLK